MDFLIYLQEKHINFTLMKKIELNIIERQREKNSQNINYLRAKKTSSICCALTLKDKTLKFECTTIQHLKLGASFCVASIRLKEIEVEPL